MSATQMFSDDQLKAFAEQRLSATEMRFIQAEADNDPHLKKRIEQIQQNIEQERDTIPQDIHGATEKGKKTRKLVPPRWMTRVMIIGWILLLVAMVIVMIDVSGKMSELEEDQKEKSK